MEMTEKKLNKRERHKAALSPFEYYPQIETLDFNGISEGDGFYLQDFGIFNTPIEEDEYTLRLRITAGRITTVQLRAIADIAKGNELEIILTARAGIQLHGLNSENVLHIFKEINELGISTWQTFGDNVRNIVTDVFDGRGCMSVIETYPLILQMQEYFLKTPHLVGMLPRRISTGISGNSANVTSFFANDLYFALAKREEIFGFNVYMGGKNTEIARSADIFLLPDEVVPFFKAFIEAFNTHGLRFTRTRTRLFHLLEEITMETFVEHIAHEYQKTWQQAGNLVLEKGLFSRYQKLQDGSYAFCYESNFGRISAEELVAIADFAETYSAEVRLSTDHNLYILGLSQSFSPFEHLKKSQTIVACAGSHYCPYSFWNIKDDAQLLPLEKIAEHRIQIGISGCGKGCGRHQHCDIGLIGLRTNNFGNTDKGARIYLGAEHSAGISVGRELFEMVPLEHIRSVIDLIIHEYERSGCDTFESFSESILNRYSVEFIALWLLAKLECGSAIALYEVEKRENIAEEDQFLLEKELFFQYFPKASFVLLIEDNLNEAIRQLSKKLWSVGESDQEIAPQIKKLLVSKKYWEV
ncbi:MAG: nitrite/sulfite reductase [Sulfuricurvum sp.]|uniref:nitrite/sulfite reductase n=1 Tax=Sulfuricurvum sp. TaxID=2025608 RepID=UPI002609FEF9|nr:nitrite/sulfite reductase [Sulfuricurvum sp.]MDD5160568.1 nitrite/sulfite reductase [Sulfuricurvum sp.]